MGKKQTIKLIQKLKKQAPGRGSSSGATSKKGKKTAAAGKGEKRDGPKFETLIARQNQAIKKRKRSAREEAEKAAEKAAAEAAKPKRVAFDAATGSVKGQAGKIRAKRDDKDMSLDEFFAGGFSAINGESDDELSSVSGDEASYDEPERETNKAKESDESSDEKAGKGGEDEGQSDKEEDDDDDEEDEDDEDEIAAHKRELLELKERDPEFYASLARESKELLDFGEGSEDDEGSEEEGSEQGDDDEAAAAAELEEKKIVVNSKVWNELERKAFKEHEAKSIKLVVALFHMCTKDAEGDAHDKAEGAKPGKLEDVNYRIPSDAIKDRVVLSALSGMCGALDAKLGIDTSSKNGGGKLPKTAKLWARYERLAKRFLTDLLRALQQSKNSDARVTLLRMVINYVPYIVSFPGKLPRAYNKFLISVWGGTTTAETTRLVAFLCIQRLAVVGRSNLGDLLKATYLEFVRGAKTSAVREQPRIAFQARCLVDLFGVDLSFTYELAFVYVRQLALHLRAAILSKTQESTQSVYSWQYLHCLRLWGAVLSAYPGKPVADTKQGNLTADEQQLRSLIYALVQVILGTIRLAPSSRNLPMRFHCTAVLLKLARASRYFIPLAPVLMDVLAMPELHGRKPGDSTARPPNLAASLKLGKSALADPHCQQAIVLRALEQLRAYMEVYRFSISYPELVLPVATALRSFSRKTRVTKWRSESRSLLNQLESWAAETKSKRPNAQFNPANVDRMNQFLTKEEDEFRAKQDEEAREAALQDPDVHNLDEEDQDDGEDDEGDEEQDDEEQDDEEQDDDDEEEDAEDGEGGDDDEDDDEPTPPKKKQRKAKPAKARAARVSTDKVEDSGDVVEDFAIESSSDEE